MGEIAVTLTSAIRKRGCYSERDNPSVSDWRQGAVAENQNPPLSQPGESRRESGSGRYAR